MNETKETLYYRQPSKGSSPKEENSDLARVQSEELLNSEQLSALSIQRELEVYALGAGEHTPFHWPNKDQHRVVQLKRSVGSWNWLGCS